VAGERELAGFGCGSENQGQEARLLEHFQKTTKTLTANLRGIMKGTIMTSIFYTLLPSTFGTFSIVWQDIEKGSKVHRVFPPNEQTPVEGLVRMTFVDAVPLSCPTIAELGERIQGFLEGEAVDFELDMIALESCSEFQQRVLLAEHRIPRGWVSTYGRIARSLGISGGARAVGRALSHNPFPIIIPCHRAIKSNGELGGFQGGLRMKRALLELEGVAFSQSGKVLVNKIYY
jgi:methylated-DNA-[protein]-cysteine S-methyltransferase